MKSLFNMRSPIFCTCSNFTYSLHLRKQLQIQGNARKEIHFTKSILLTLMRKKTIPFNPRNLLSHNQADALAGPHSMTPLQGKFDPSHPTWWPRSVTAQLHSSLSRYLLSRASYCKCPLPPVCTQTHPYSFWAPGSALAARSLHTLWKVSVLYMPAHQKLWNRSMLTCEE